MKRIINIVLIFLIAYILFLTYSYNNKTIETINDNNKIINDINNLKSDIDNKKKEVVKKEKELEEIKKNNQDILRKYELWKKEKEKLQIYLP